MQQHSDHIKNPYADFSKLVNRNERRLQKILIEMLDEKDPRLSIFSEKDLQDVYALANNFLRPKYVHKGTIVLRDEISNEEIDLAIDDAINIVRTRPKT